jgi:Kdo2-lipid IVA lauroyltransferase/acyltransferase
MARNPSPVAVWSQYLAARAAAMLLTMFEADVNLRSAAFIGRRLHRLDRRHRDRARRHLAMAFPELSPRQVERLNLRSFEHFIQLVVEVMHTPRLIDTETWPRHIRFGNLGETVALLNARKPVIMLTGHVGNWELTGTLLAALGYRVEAVARPLDNPLVNDWLLGIREARGMRILTKWDATDRMIDVLNCGGALAFIADQNAGDRGLFVPFFGKLASAYKSIGLLAITQNVPIVCGFARRLDGRYQYEASITDLIRPQDWAGRRDPLYYVTARYTRAIELMIRACPEQYLWMHRRWKSRPRFEREGKPMPDALRRNLQELPWMDQITMDRLAKPIEAVK